MLTLVVVVEQNTRLIERLDHSMAQLTQAVSDLRVQMIQGHAELRQEISNCKTELRQEMAVMQVELRKEMLTMHLELHNFVEQKFNRLLGLYVGSLVAFAGFAGKYLFDTYFT